MVEPSGANQDLTIVILGAGEGTRMKSSLPKPLHALAGRPMLDHVVTVAEQLAPREIIVVASPILAESWEPEWPQVRVLIQDPPKGTGDAVRTALDSIEGGGAVLVLYADHPTVTPETLETLLQESTCPGVVVALLTAWVEDAAGYGRIARDSEGHILGVVERGDDDAAMRIGETEINSGFMCLDLDWAKSALQEMPPNAATGEYFLTDLIAAGVSTQSSGNSWPISSVEGGPDVLTGINDRFELGIADSILRNRIRRRLQIDGVTLVGAETIFIDVDVEIGKDTTVLPNTLIERHTRIGEHCTIGPGSAIRNSWVGDHVTITSSNVEDSNVADSSDIGPFAHLRDGARIGRRVHIGNFAELKNAELGDDVRVGHFSYLGDASVGARTNIGAGAVTCNFDGVDKHRTEIGRDVFIGSDSMLVAPIRLGDGARTGAGAVVTRDVPDGGTVVGMPARAVPRQTKSSG